VYWKVVVEIAINPWIMKVLPFVANFALTMVM
jgi:hypothetical protein